MRVFSETVRTLILSGDVSPFFLIETQIPSANLTGIFVANSVVEGSYTVVRETTTPIDLVVPTLGTFYSNNGIKIVQGPRQSSSVDRETYILTYIDPSFEKRALFEAGVTGSKLKVIVGFYNTSSGILSGTLPDMPILNVADMLIAYAGVIDTHGYTIDPASGEVVVVIECSSPMASLGLVKSFYTSREAMKQINPADTAFDQVSVNQSKTTYLWGKA
jgi:hypothetical protein